MPPRCITSRLLSHLPAAIAHSCDLQVALFPKSVCRALSQYPSPLLRQLPRLRSHQAPPTTFLSSTRSSILPHGARPGGDNGTDACTRHGDITPAARKPCRLLARTGVGRRYLPPPTPRGRALVLSTSLSQCTTKYHQQDIGCGSVSPSPNLPNNAAPCQLFLRGAPSAGCILSDASHPPALWKD